MLLKYLNMMKWWLGLLSESLKRGHPFERRRKKEGLGDFKVTQCNIGSDEGQSSKGYTMSVWVI